MKAFLLALQFLTVAMPSRDLAADADDFARSRAWYGVVGGLLGLALAGAALLLRAMGLPALAVAGLLVALWGLQTRLLHLDGVADTADALGTTADRGRALEIMKDTHAGSFAVAAVSGVLLLKFAALASLEGAALAGALVAAPALARVAPVFISGLLPPARGDKGLGAAVAGGPGLGREFACGASALAIALIAAGPAGALAALAVLAAGWGLGLWYRRRLGGYTGDTLGASVELCELAALLAMGAF